MVYRGEFNSKTREREGFGIEYDETSGMEQRSGYYRNDELFHVFQEFRKVKEEKEKGSEHKIMEMIEYGGERDKKNVDDVLSLCPIYIGDYVYDTNQLRFIRSRVGNVLNANSGICDRICEWDDKGEKKGSDIELHGGWYGEGRRSEDDGIEGSQLKETEKGYMKGHRNEKVTICPGLTLRIAREIENLEVRANTFNRCCKNNSKMKNTY